MHNIIYMQEIAKKSTEFYPISMALTLTEGNQKMVYLFYNI